jgi:RNA polymerase sigma-70 factor (ECF subfamily)
VNHVYAGDPYHRDVFAARLALAQGLNALRQTVDAVDALVVNTIRGDGAERTGNRRHVNESPGVRIPPTSNTKPLPGGGRVAVPGRPSMPAQPTAGQRSQLPESPAVGENTVVVPAQSTTGPPSESEPPKAEPPKYGARPDPGDAAAEVWALVERAQAGESEAFGLIYDRYVDTVFRFVYFRVGNRQLAEDLTSDTFLRALKRIGSFTWQGRDLGAWLVTIARNLVADHFKSGRYRLEVTTGDVLDADREDRGPEGSPESAVVDHITNVALLTAVKQLNPEQQECIVLRFLQGFSVAETAQTMGKNEGAIKALQYRAVRALARLLPEGFQW